ncbi:hypothetical protein Tco_1113041 [Tanacetum coccineum]|uniref:Uncharacterized protein n=1 Tax=Tanacetum coccineum TaxID=301880 RepID=A0ABQ5IU24_9ASTR
MILGTSVGTPQGSSSTEITDLEVYPTQLPSSLNRTITSSSNQQFNLKVVFARNKAMVHDGKLWFKESWKTRAHARECPRPKRLQDSDYFKDKMLLMQAQESGAVLAWKNSRSWGSCWRTADECDAFDFDVDEGPITQTMFMTNLTSEDLIYDEAGTSYDSNTPSEVHDHDTFVNHLDEYHEVHEMQTDEQHNYVVDSDADYTSNSNTIPYDQYMEDNEDHVVQRDVSSVRNDALMSILDEMHEQGVQSRLANKPDMVVNDLVNSELARYKELVGEYEKRAKFELTDRERKIDEQMRIIISDRNRKETSLKSELHSAQILLSSTVDHYKSKTEEVTLLKKDFKQKEDKFLKSFWT